METEGGAQNEKRQGRGEHGTERYWTLAIYDRILGTAILLFNYSQMCGKNTSPVNLSYTSGPPPPPIIRAEFRADTNRADLRFEPIPPWHPPLAKRERQGRIPSRPRPASFPWKSENVTGSSPARPRFEV